MLFPVLMSVLALQAAPPSAEAAPEAAPEAASVQWSRPPRAETPPKALQDRVGGTATLRCAFTDGAPTACRIVAESPAGYGFGMAALRAARTARAANGLDGSHEFSLAFEVR